MTERSSRFSSTTILCIIIACVLIAGAGVLFYRHASSWLERKIVHQAADDTLLVLTPNSVIETWPEPNRMNAFCRKVQLANLRTNILAQLDATLASGTLSPAHQAALQQYVKTAKLFFSAIDAAFSEADLQKIASGVGDLAGYLGASSSRVGKIKSWLGSLFGYGQKVIEQYAHKNPCLDRPEGKLSLVDRVVANKMVNALIVQHKPDAECTQAERLEKQATTAIKDAIARKLHDTLHDQGKKELVRLLLPYVLLFVSVAHT